MAKKQIARLTAITENHISKITKEHLWTYVFPPNSSRGNPLSKRTSTSLPLTTLKSRSALSNQTKEMFHFADLEHAWNVFWNMIKRGIPTFVGIMEHLEHI